MMIHKVLDTHKNVVSQSLHNQFFDYNLMNLRIQKQFHQILNLKSLVETSLIPHFKSNSIIPFPTLPLPVTTILSFEKQSYLAHSPSQAYLTLECRF